MGDAASKKPPSLTTMMINNSSSYSAVNGYHGGRRQSLEWYRFCFAAPRTTQCDSKNEPLPPPPLPPPPPSSSSSTAAAPPPPPSPSSTSSEEADSIAAAAQAVAAVPNPGTYENSSFDCRRLLNLDIHDGFRCEVSKQLNPFMAVVHNFWLGSSMIPDGRTYSYSLVTQVANEYGLLMARVDPNRQSLDGRVHTTFPIPVRFQLGVSADGQSDQLLAETDFGRQTWAANLKYGSMGGGLVWGGNFFQSITPRLAMGGEGMYIAANNNLLSSYTVKYTIPARTGEEDSPFTSALTLTPEATAAAAAGTKPELWKGSSMLCANWNMGQSLLTMSYFRVVTPQRVTLAAELQCNPLSLDSQVALGAEFRLSRNKLNTVIDGSGKIQSILETKLERAPGSPALSFTAEMDHAKEVTRFGYGITFEGS